MADPITLALLSTAISGSAGLISNTQGRRAAKANRRANELERERRGIQNNLARRKARAEERRLQASIRAEALAAGVGLSSGADAASASVDAQLSTELATQTQLQDIDIDRTNEIQRAQRFGQQSSNTDQIGQFAAGFIGAFT